ncbi:MAG: ester cyclase [Terracidiphilus sp.]
MSTQATLPYLNARNDAAFRFLNLPTLMRSTAETTGGSFGLIENWSIPPGFASPYHTHHREDEAFYVLEGELAFICDGKWMRGGPGTYVFGPRELAHGFKVIGHQPARMLLLCAPGGFEGFVLELGQPADAPAAPPDMAQLAEVAAKYHIEIHGPLPEEPAEFADAGSAATDLKAINRLWIEAFNSHDWAAERTFRSDDFMAHLSGSPAPLDNNAWSGFMQQFTTAFPDAQIIIQSCIGEADRTATTWTLTGTHRAPFNGIPATGREVQFAGIEFNRFVDGRIAEHHAQFDLAGLLVQLGAIPA